MRLETDYWHILPHGDIKEHTQLRSCKCKPTASEADGLIIHNAYDGREFFEGDEDLTEVGAFPMADFVRDSGEFEQLPNGDWQRVAK